MKSNPDSALIRGLSLVRHVMGSDEPVRFSEFREVLSGASDSTLTRILQALEEHGYVDRTPTNGYRPGTRLGEWKAVLREKPTSLQEAAGQAVVEASRRANESAAFAVLEDDHISILASHTADGAVSILPTGGLLHVEADHAAALAILDQLSTKRMRRLLSGHYSRMRGIDEFSSGRNAALVEENRWMDSSKERPGICRMAVPLKQSGLTAALFLCLTRERAERDSQSLFTILENCRDRLLMALN